MVFAHDRQSHHIADPKQPEYAVALPETWVRAQYALNRLTVQEPTRYGYWCQNSIHDLSGHRIGD